MITMTPGKAVSILRSAIVNARIYPKGSQMIEASLKGAHQAVAACMPEKTSLLITDVQGKLFINGKEAPEARDFRSFMVQHEIQTINFLYGVEVSEITTLVEGLGKRKGQLDDHKSLGDWLKAQNVRHITAEQTEFVALQKGDVVVQQIQQLLEQTMGDPASLVSSLEESYRLMDQLPDNAARKEVQKKMASQLASLSPHELRDLFESKLPDNVEKSGLKEDVVQAMSRDKLESTLEEVNKWYAQIKQDSQSEFEVVEKLNGLKSFLGKILHSPASKTVPFALYEELLNVGLLDEMPAGVIKGENSSLLSQVEELLSQPSAVLMEAHIRQRFPDLLKALCAMGLDDPLNRLTDKVLENLQNLAPLVRETCVKTLSIFVESFTANRKEKPFIRIVGRLRDLAESESSPEVYGEAAQVLRIASMELLVNWKFEECAMILAMLRRHSREESPIGHKKKQLAAKALQDFSTRGLDVICADLNAPLKDRQNGSYRVLAELGEEAVNPLIEALKRSVDPRAKQAAIQALKHLGAAVKEPLVRHLTVGTPTEVLTKLLPLIEDFADVSLLQTLTGLLPHPDVNVRRLVAQIFAKVKDPRSQALMLSLLDDSDTEMQSEVLRLISEIKLKSAVPEIQQRLFKAHPSVQEEMCIALGNIGDRKAVPDLAKLLTTRRPFWKRTGGVTDAVRIRAIWGLGQLMPDAIAEKAIQTCLKDSNSLVQRAAQTALSRATSSAKQAA